MKESNYERGDIELKKDTPMCIYKSENSGGIRTYLASIETLILFIGLHFYLLPLSVEERPRGPERTLLVCGRGPAVPKI